MRLGKRKAILLSISILILVSIIGIYYVYDNTQEVEYSTVVIAKENIFPEENIEGKVKAVKRPTEYVPENVVNDISELKNMKSKTHISAGGYIYKKMYQDISNFPENTLAIDLENYSDFLLADMVANNEYMAIFSSEGLYHNTIKFKYLYNKTETLEDLHEREGNRYPKFTVISFDTFEEAKEFAININKYDIKTISVSKKDLENYEYKPLFADTQLSKQLNQQKKELGVFEEKVENDEENTEESSAEVEVEEEN